MKPPNTNEIPIATPSSFLPPLKPLILTGKDTGSEDINTKLKNALGWLRWLYIPEVRGTARRRPIHISLEDGKEQGQGSTRKEKEEELEEIRADPFERNFTIQWLTRVISLGSSYGEAEEGGIAAEILDDASALLAICAGTAASGAVTRVFRFRLKGRVAATDGGEQEEGEEVTVDLRDASFESSDTSSLGNVTWGGACVMAEMIGEDPEAFAISSEGLGEGIGMRALELGAGTGLVSLVYAKFLEVWAKHREGRGIDEVVATDFHPSVLENLRVNYEVNFPSQSQNTTSSTASQNPLISTSVLPLDWSTIHSIHTQPPSNSTSLKDELPLQLRVKFDVILGADIIYESLHARWIRSCVERFLKKPSPSPTAGFIPLFHLIIPLRKTFKMESKSVEEVFRTVESLQKERGEMGGERELELAIIHQEDIICDAYSGEEAGEVVYRYYKIAWV
ncbi:hypothetical protein M422DRAFT_23182 [Sphaerobolus stellatus SS14]|nr:hypothetical protein M422DRAFT_23182 [Sphaerobolus stellatus SS14]